VRIAESQRDGTMTFERAVPGVGYRPGEPLNLALSLDYPADSPPVTALAAVEQLPEGCQFLEISSDPRPIIEPPEGATGTLNFVWTEVPSFPFQFSYAVQVPESEGGGTRQLAGNALYRTDGPEETTALATTEIGPQPGT
jgi:hypothetical protein